MPVWVEPVARQLAGGLVVTVELSLLSGLIGCLVGILLGTLQTLRAPLVTAPVRAYVEVWRGLPVILTLFFIFFGLPALGVRLPAFVSAILGLSLWASANIAEIVRGAVSSIPREQWEAATALGLGWARSMVFVILPQAVRRMLPPLVSLLTNLVQTSALAAILGVSDLLSTAQRQIQRLTILGNSHAIEILAAVMGVYFVICFILTRISANLEARRTV
jgi:polar amino acid transport system permease protein